MQTLCTNCDCLVAVDPGRKPIITAVVHNTEAEFSVNLLTGSSVRHEVLKVSQKQFYTDTGYTHCNKKTKEWMWESELVTNFNANMESAKTTSMPALQAHIRYCLNSL